MIKGFLSCVLLVQLSFLPLSLAAQSARPRGNAASEPVSVTFTFNSACEDCAMQSGEAGESRYFVDVPLTNNPSPATSVPADDLSLEVRIKQDRLVYGIQFKPGTSPRAVWRNGGRVLQVFFVPPGVAVAQPVEAARVIAAPRASTEEAAQGSPVAERAHAALAPALAPPTPAGAVQPGAPPNFLPTNSSFNPSAAGSADFAEVDLSVPESPAFTVLGLTPQTVVRPTSPRQFVSSLLSGVDTNGNFQSGLALDFVPYLMLTGDELTLSGYQENYLQRLLSRTQVSFASTKGASDDDKSMRLAIGFHVTLWDRGDPRTDQVLMNCLRQMVLPRRPTQLEPELVGTTPQEIQDFNDSVKRFNADKDRYERDKQAAIEFNNGVSTRCRDESRQRNWNRSSWIVAAAPSWISQTGETKNYKWNGGGFWSSLAYGFEGVPGLKERSQLILHARYRNREQVPDPDAEGEFITQDSMFFGARFRHGSPTFNGSFEYTFLRSRPNGGSFDNAQRLALGFERRIAGDTWFNLSLGGEAGRANGKNNGFVITSFKWAFSDRKDVPPADIPVR